MSKINDDYNLVELHAQFKRKSANQSNLLACINRLIAARPEDKSNLPPCLVQNEEVLALIKEKLLRRGDREACMAELGAGLSQSLSELDDDEVTVLAVLSGARSAA